MDSWIIS